MNKRFGIMQIIVASVLVIGLVITIIKFSGSMKTGSPEGNVINSKENPKPKTSIVQVSNRPTDQGADTPKISPTNMNSNKESAFYKLTLDEITDLVNQGIIIDSK